MTTVFLSGSRKISRLNAVIRTRMQDILEQGSQIIIGDANGADKAMQSYLAKHHYPNVLVFCSGGVCRNNVGAWTTRKINIDKKLRGRAFYTQKDKVMALEADCGLVLWDGQSEGSINNVFELVKSGKAACVYLASHKKFFNVKSADDVDHLMRLCGPDTLQELQGSSHLRRQMESLDITAQRCLRL